MDSLRAFVAFVFSKVGICVLVIGYLLVGAVMFQNLEGPDEEKKRYEMEHFRSESVKLLWKTTEEFNTLHPKNWTLKVSHLIQEYQERIILEARKGYEGSDIPDPKWTFTGSLLYSITVITTIGNVYLSVSLQCTQSGKTRKKVSFDGTMNCLPQRLKSTFFEKNSSAGSPKVTRNEEQISKKH